MKVLVKIGELFEKYMAVIVLIIAIVSLFFPASTSWIDTKWINYLLAVIMFGMGLTIKPKDFAIVFTRPKEVIIGCLAQYIIMPLLAFLLTKIFNLDPALAAGVVLVGTCPGGTASNVITFLSKGDVALSVGMTTISTLLSPLLTPVMTYLLLKTSADVDVLSMILSIVQIILLPIILGFILNRVFSNFAEKAVKVLPTISTIGICLIVGSVVSHNSEKILSTGYIVLIVVILHNLLGYLSGFAIGKIFKMPIPKIKALSIEIGMQNSGLASSLATTAFPDLAMATVPGAIFSVWHNISGAILAAIYRRWGVKDTEEKDNKDADNKELERSGDNE